MEGLLVLKHVDERGVRGQSAELQGRGRATRKRWRRWGDEGNEQDRTCIPHVVPETSGSENIAGARE